MFASGALLLNAIVPVLADTTIQISGNGAGSDNYANVTSTSQTSVTQSNTANISNDVNSTATTGSNDSNFNTGGQTTTMTGAANVTSDVSTQANENVATTNCCGTGDTTVKISGNGAESTSTVTPDISNKTTLDQSNKADISNNIDSTATTGKNDANSNTGGTVYIKTGSANIDNNVDNKANVNIAMIGDPSSATTPTMSFQILGNGAGSDNFITPKIKNSTSIDQDNSADINNNIDSYAKSGGNDANFNTGGDVTIEAGQANAESNVSNMANFNFASADCGCVYDLLAKIDGNGAGFNNDGNTIALTLKNTRLFDQSNGADFNNNLDTYAKSGYNDANSNTGSVTDPSDPTIITGNANIDQNVNNVTNKNVVSDGLSLPSDFSLGNISFGFDWSALVAFFGLHFS